MSRTHVLRLPWAERYAASSRGGRYDSALKAVTLIGEVPVDLLPHATRPHTWERWLEDDLNAGEAGAAIAGEIGDPITLRPHQVEAVKEITAAKKAGRAGFLLGDETGIGKTITSIGAALAMPGVARVLVLAPLSTLPAWRTTISTMDPGGRVRWVALNYDRNKSLLSVPASAASAKRAKTKNKNTAKDGKSLVDWDLVICDESHLLSNPVSQRSAAVRRISGEGGSRRAFTLWMSATAGATPLALSYLSPVLAGPGGERPDLKSYEEWCARVGLKVRRAAYGKWEWEANDADVASMHAMLYDTGIGLRRRPSDIEGWPEVNRITAPVELSAKDKAAYALSWEEFRASRRMDTATTKGARTTNALTRALRLRQKASLLRVPGTALAVREALDNGFQVAVSMEFRESIEAMAAELSDLEVAIIHGGVTGEEREAERVRFQRGEAVVVLYSITSGLNLHSGEDAVGGNTVPRMGMHEVKYSPIPCLQAEGRCVLEGQLVQTRRGAVPIQEVEVGDKVLTHLGAWKDVTDVWSRGSGTTAVKDGGRGRRLITEITYQGSEPLAVTHDHELWVRHSDGTVGWCQAHDVLPGDFLATPRPISGAGLKSMVFPMRHRRYPLENVRQRGRCSEQECDKPVLARTLCQNHYRAHIELVRGENGCLPVLDRSTTVNGRYAPAPETVMVDEHFLRFAGWYLAEGFSGRNAKGVPKLISLSGHVSERAVLEGHGAYLAREWGLKCSIKGATSSPNGIELRAWGHDLASWMAQEFGHLAHNKHMPSWFWNLGREQQRTMLWSYLEGDGSFRTSRSGRENASWGTSSRGLHEELNLAFAALGRKASTWSSAPSSTREIRGKKVISRGQHYGEFPIEGEVRNVVVDESHLWRSVGTVSTRRARNGERVWDLSVQDDESYVVGTAAVHNCHRNGQNSLQVYFYAEETSERAILETVLARAKVMKDMSGDDTTDLALVIDDLLAGVGSSPVGHKGAAV